MGRKVTKALMLSERRCGLHYFDKAVAKIGLDALIDKAIAISKADPHTWGDGWPNFAWAFGNAIRETLSLGDAQMTFNTDDALDAVSMARVALALNIRVEDYKPSWTRD